MTLQQLKYALTIADCGSMNEAAKTLFLSQPSLSETIRELETEIGFEVHNPGGCSIFVGVEKTDTETLIHVEDNGVGITDEKLEVLRTTPHYMMSDSGTTEPRHGLGLLIVQQIVAAHEGYVSFDHGEQGGFAVTISFPNPKDS